VIDRISATSAASEGYPTGESLSARGLSTKASGAVAW
jgi:hypothetical protein